MIFYDFEIKPDWNKRNKMLLRVSDDTTFDRMVSIIINGIGLDSGHLYALTVVKDGTTRKQQWERGSKVIDEGADIPLPNLWQYPNPQEYDRAARRIVKETHFTYEPLSVIKWKSGMKMWLLYDFGDMDYFIITCTNVTTGGYQEDKVVIEKHFSKISYN
jgi:hypothetical protein